MLTRKMRKLNPPQRELTFKAFDSFRELRKDYEAEVRAMTSAERIAMMENLRRDYFRVKGLPVTDKVERTLEISVRRK